MRLRLLRSQYADRIIVGIEPALKPAVEAFPNGQIGIMATQVTLREEKFDALMHRFDAGCAVEKIPAPGLVELIEAGKADSAETEALLHTILTPYIGKLDALVLGCTHYPFVGDAIKGILGAGTVLLDGGEGTARQTRRCLEAAGLRNDSAGSVQIENSTGSGALVKLSMELLNR